MIALDTSALMAILGNEPAAGTLVEALQGDRDLVISAATLAEALIVADRRNVGDVMRRLVSQLSPIVVQTDEATAARVAFTYDRWGKGQHPAQLNLTDCFAYDLATQRDCPLLFIGDDFGQTDVRNALR